MTTETVFLGHAARIKNEVLGTDVLVVEFYPPAGEVVNASYATLVGCSRGTEAWYRELAPAVNSRAAETTRVQ
jgi:hypothetical protein